MKSNIKLEKYTFDTSDACDVRRQNSDYTFSE